MSRNRDLLPLGVLLLAMLPVFRDAQGGQWAPITDEVEFQCDKGNTTWGYSVYVTGNRAELGNWDPATAVKLAPRPAPNNTTWTGKVLFQNPDEKVPVEWKCIVRKENDPTDVKWQPGPNNTLMLIFRTKSIGTF